MANLEKIAKQFKDSDPARHNYPRKPSLEPRVKDCEERLALLERKVEALVQRRNMNDK